MVKEVGGGKPKKPISARDKRRKAAPQPAKKKKEERYIAYHDLSESLTRRASKAVESMDLITPYTLATTLNIKLSLARRVLRLLAENGVVKVIDKSRALIIAVPASKASKA